MYYPAKIVYEQFYSNESSVTNDTGSCKFPNIDSLYCRIYYAKYQILKAEGVTHTLIPQRSVLVLVQILIICIMYGLMSEKSCVIRGISLKEINDLRVR